MSIFEVVGKRRGVGDWTVMGMRMRKRMGDGEGKGRIWGEKGLGGERDADAEKEKQE